MDKNLAAVDDRSQILLAFLRILYTNSKEIYIVEIKIT
jgi:hypothetical protein